MNAAGQDAVRISRMEDALYKASERKVEMEALKMHSDVVFLKGVRVG